MKSGDKASGKTASAQRHKAVMPKRRKAAAGSRRRSSPIVGEETDVALLRRERDEAVEQQRATSEVLRTISNASTDATSILGTIAESVARLLNVTDAEIVMRIEGDLLESVAKYGPSPNWPVGTTRALSRDWVTGRAVIDRTAVHVPDLLVPQHEFPQGAAFARQFGHRTTLAVPLLREGSAIGAILIRRMEVNPFTDRQIALVSSFASQAVIAIENTRLFNETREALERQTATSEILKVIASSPSNVQPVFDAIASSATCLIGGFSSTVILFIDGVAHLKALTSTTPEADEILKSVFPRPAADFPPFRNARIGEIEQIADTEVMPTELRDLARARGYRSVVFAPLENKGTLIGVIGVTRVQSGPFSEHHLQLLRTFADQAVIAIENTRLFNETREALEQQTATVDILKVIASSPGDLTPVFDVMLENATRLCEASHCHVWRFDLGLLHAVAVRGDPWFTKWLQEHSPVAPIPGSAADRIAHGENIVHVADRREEEAYSSDPVFRDLVDTSGVRASLSVALRREGMLLGMINVYRKEVRPFSDRQVALLQNFAAQAVIAMENARLFSEVQARTRELSASLDDLRTTQDRLVQTQKLALLGQLTAGIAHEIKNPLNFVNNFSGISSELIGELQETVNGLSIDSGIHAELNELTEMLRANLEKVVQHGKRADAIVKSMLLHSGQSSGEHRLSDINALVEESLNRAYYGERAETRGFTIKLEKFFDPAVGEVDLFPREITRALLNLIANGFYATTKRKETDGGDYEPALLAATRNLGDRVEIRIRDNGSGIPTDVKEKMFDPFFTTKPPGEGTGLGLSITHDIIVKQHGGSIEVDTKLGEFAEVRVILPRAGALLSERR